MAVAIEDAGFEIRDTIMWLYGSGFPKSHDISKAIDRRGGQGATLSQQIGKALKKAREKRNISKSQADKMFCDGTTNWTWFEGRPAGQRPPTPETFARIVAEWEELKPLAKMVEEAEREVVGNETKARSTNGKSALPTIGGDTIYQTWDITAPATEEAKQWEGWGTALKPAYEPILLARKPISTTVADNVLTHGVGGLNIDECRIGLNGDKKTGGFGAAKTGYHKGIGNGGDEDYKTVWQEDTNGRFPANIIHDGSEEVVEGFPETHAAGNISNNRVGLFHKEANIKKSTSMFGIGQVDVNPSIIGDNGGSASRFFYTAKASKKDRDEGTKQNIHPTVKPTDLMQYLIRLIAPKGATVLDIFMGSGSTGKAAMIENVEREANYHFIGIDRTEEYLPIAQARIEFGRNYADEKPKAEGIVHQDQVSLFELI
jgi:hypothetical protein